MPPAMADDTGSRRSNPAKPGPWSPSDLRGRIARPVGQTRIRTAATVQHVLDQATVLDLPTDMMPPVDSDGQPIAPAPGQRPAVPTGTRTDSSERNMPLLIGLAVAALLVVIALVIMLAKFFGGSGDAGTAHRRHSDRHLGCHRARPGPRSLCRTSASSTSPTNSGRSVDECRQRHQRCVAVWHTDHYRFSADFGRLKPERSACCSTSVGRRPSNPVTIATPTRASTVELRTAQSGRLRPRLHNQGGRRSGQFGGDHA